MNDKGFRIEVPLHLKRDRRARKVLAQGDAPKVQDPVPRAARLLALAWKWEGMVRRGEARNHTEIARQHGLSRARVSQICSLVLLAPALQDDLLSPSGIAPHVGGPSSWVDLLSTWEVREVSTR